MTPKFPDVMILFLFKINPCFKFIISLIMFLLSFRENAISITIFSICIHKFFSFILFFILFSISSISVFITHLQKVAISFSELPPEILLIHTLSSNCNFCIILAIIIIAFLSLLSMYTPEFPPSILLILIL